MWVIFKAKSPFLVKIFVGGVNAVSGESAVETQDTVKRRINLLKQGKDVQDYVIPPKQMWLDGIASRNGVV